LINNPQVESFKAAIREQPAAEANMPAKKMTLTDAERAKRIRVTAREFGTGNDPASFERAFANIVQLPKQTAKTDAAKK
jgi:hypothetical protein